MADAVAILVPLVAELEPAEREKRWTHLSLCILDAVFSMAARYETTTATVWRYATDAELADPLLPTERAREVVGTDREEPLSALLKRIADSGLAPWTDEVIRNRQRTSSRSGIPKAEAAQSYARRLVSHGIETLDAVASLLGDDERLAEVECDLAQVPGHGYNDVRLTYLWMLAGDNDVVKPDRMVLRWLTRALGRPIDSSEARVLVDATANRLSFTPWAVDHAIWNAERSVRRPTLSV